MGRRFLLISVALVLGTGVGILVCEAALRVAGVEYPGYYQIDPVFGAVLRPGASGWYRSEGEAFVSISSAGLRDREHSVEKPPRVVRIAVLGDSYAEAKQVDVEQTFWWRLGESLGDCPRFAGKTVEPINFGVSGYGTVQELLMLRHRVWQFSPDVVLLAFVPNNDVRNNLEALQKTEMRPYFELQGDELVLDDSLTESTRYKRRNNWAWRLADRVLAVSRLFQVVNEMTNRVAARRVAREREAQGVPEGMEVGLSSLAFLPPPDENWEEAWRVTEAMIAEMAREVRAGGAEFWLASFTIGSQVHPDPEVPREFAERIGVPDLLEADRRLQRLGRREGFPVISLAPELQALAQREQLLLHGFENAQLGGGHWNADGHRAAAGVLSPAICAGAADGEG